MAERQEVSGEVAGVTFQARPIRIAALQKLNQNPRANQLQLNTGDNLLDYFVDGDIQVDGEFGMSG